EDREAHGAVAGARHGKALEPRIARLHAALRARGGDAIHDHVAPALVDVVLGGEDLDAGRSQPGRELLIQDRRPALEEMAPGRVARLDPQETLPLPERQARLFAR